MYISIIWVYSWTRQQEERSAVQCLSSWAGFSFSCQAWWLECITGLRKWRILHIILLEEISVGCRPFRKEQDKLLWSFRVDPLWRQRRSAAVQSEHSHQVLAQYSGSWMKTWGNVFWQGTIFIWCDVAEWNIFCGFCVLHPSAARKHYVRTHLNKIWLFQVTNEEYNYYFKKF